MRLARNAAIVVLAFVVGATSMYLLRREPTSRWISVASDGGGFGMTDEALNGDIPWPKTTKPSGRVKFVSRDNGERLGYILTLPIGPNPTAALPEKYRRITKDKNGMEFLPPDQVLYQGHFEFTLKDADGFVLLKIDGPVEHLSSASDNSVQGTTEQTVQTSAIMHTRSVDVSFLVTACTPCEPQ